MNDLAKNLIVWLVLAAILMSVFNGLSQEPEKETLDYSAFLIELQNDRISQVITMDEIIYGERNDGSAFKTVRPDIPDAKLMVDLMIQ